MQRYNILINGISAKSGGGRSVLTNFLTVLKKKGSFHKFYVITPNIDEYAEFAAPNISIIPARILSNTLLLPFVNAVLLPYMVRKLECNIVFNLADIPMPTHAKQLFLFDWSYAVYPGSHAWRLSSVKEMIVRNSKLFLFKKYLKYVTVMIAQTEVIKKRLNDIYGIQDVLVVSNAVSVNNLSNAINYDFNLGKGFKLLCLSRYYSHKNIEIFLPLAELIKSNGYDIKIITTIDKNQCKAASAFLGSVKDRMLDEIIINVGSVPMKHVPSLYKQADGLLLPTLLESFSGTYVEAMYYGKPIFTSNLEFATGICGDSAYYFDPHNPAEILKRLNECQNEPETLKYKLIEGKRILSKMLTWEEVFYGFMLIIEMMGNKE